MKLILLAASLTAALFLLHTVACQRSVFTQVCGSPGEVSQGEFLQRVQRSLSRPNEVARVTGRTEIVIGVRRTLWRSEAWYDPRKGVVSLRIERDPSSPDELAHDWDALTFEFGLVPEKAGWGPSEEPGLSSDTSCIEGSTTSVGLVLLCGPWLAKKHVGALEVEGTLRFEGRSVRSLALRADGNRVARLLVDAETFLPVAQVSSEDDTIAFFTAYTVTFEPAASATPD